MQEYKPFKSGKVRMMLVTALLWLPLTVFPHLTIF